MEKLIVVAVIAFISVIQALIKKAKEREAEAQQRQAGRPQRMQQAGPQNVSSEIDAFLNQVNQQRPGQPVPAAPQQTRPAPTQQRRRRSGEGRPTRQRPTSRPNRSADRQNSSEPRRRRPQRTAAIPKAELVEEPQHLVSVGQGVEQDAHRIIHGYTPGDELRKMLRDPTDIRRAMILNEVLAPPLSLRKKSNR